MFDSEGIASELSTCVLSRRVQGLGVQPRTNFADRRKATDWVFGGEALVLQSNKAGTMKEGWGAWAIAANGSAQRLWFR